MSAIKYDAEQREGLSNLLRDAEAGKFKHLIVFRSDRLARKSKDFLRIKNKLQKNGVNIIYSNQGGYEAPNGHQKDFVDNIFMAIAELEGKIITERTSQGITQRRKQGIYSCPNGTTLGYVKYKADAADENKKDANNNTNADYDNFKPDKKKSKIIPKIIEGCLKIDPTYTYKHLIKDIKKLDASFSSGTIDKILSNPVYCGYLIVEPQKFCIEHILNEVSLGTQSILHSEKFQKCINVDPIIHDPQKYFEAVLKWKQSYPQSPKEEKYYLFKNLLHCDVCHKKIYLINKRYKCLTKNCTSIAELELKTELLHKIIEDIVTKEKVISFLLNKLTEENKQLTKQKKLLNRLEAKEQKILNSYLTSFSSNDKEMYQSQINELKKQQEKVWECEDAVINLENDQYFLSQALFQDKDFLNSDEYNNKSLKSKVSLTKENIHKITNLLLSNEKVTQKLFQLSIEKVNISEQEPMSFDVEYASNQ